MKTARCKAALPLLKVLLYSLVIFGANLQHRHQQQTLSLVQSSHNPRFVHLLFVLKVSLLLESLTQPTGTIRSQDDVLGTKLSPGPFSGNSLRASQGPPGKSPGVGNAAVDCAAS